MMVFSGMVFSGKLAFWLDKVALYIRHLFLPKSNFRSQKIKIFANGDDGDC